MSDGEASGDAAEHEAAALRTALDLAIDEIRSLADEDLESMDFDDAFPLLNGIINAANAAIFLIRALESEDS